MADHAQRIQKAVKTLVFSGTTEGRKLSEMLATEGMEHLVCVATKYGSEVMNENPYVKLNIGRMDSDEMDGFLATNGFGAGDIVVDATHPYATEVSENIRESSGKRGCTLIRVKRGGEEYDHSKGADSYVNQYGSIEEFAKHIGSSEGNILLTTGSKELPKYCENVSASVLARTYVRILPAVESLEICERCGIEKSHIIAMQGPFTPEMNAALMKQYGIRHLLTKDSGHEGGFDEKKEAARQLGVTLHVISRPQIAEDAVSIREAFERIAGHKYIPKRHIVLAGIGMGDISCMTQEVIDAIKSADALFGASSVVDAAVSAVFGRDGSGDIPAKRYDVYLAKDIIQTLEKEVDITNAAILFSGDTGFYSGAGEAYRQLSQWDGEADVALLPGVSSVSYLAAKFGRSYEDAKIESVHGRNSLHNMEELADRIRTNPKVFALMSGDEDVRTIAKMLLDRGIDVTVNIGRNLSYDGPDQAKRESIESLSVKEAAKYNAEGKITMLFINDRPENPDDKQ